MIWLALIRLGLPPKLLEYWAPVPATRRRRSPHQYYYCLVVQNTRGMFKAGSNWQSWAIWGVTGGQVYKRERENNKQRNQLIAEIEADIIPGEFEGSVCFGQFRILLLRLFACPSIRHSDKGRRTVIRAMGNHKWGDVFFYTYEFNGLICRRNERMPKSFQGVMLLSAKYKRINPPRKLGGQRGKEPQ